MIEVKVRRPCRENGARESFKMGMTGVRCVDCGQWSGRKDQLISHVLVEEWVFLSELFAMAKEERAA
jgi:hypothetical protein